MTATPQPSPDPPTPGAVPDASSDTATGAAHRFGAAKVVISILLGMLVVWFFWNALDSLIKFPRQLELLGAVDQTPWLILSASVVAPPLIFGLSILLARRQPLAQFTLVLIVALGAVATTRLSLIATAASLSGF